MDCSKVANIMEYMESHSHSIPKHPKASESYIWMTLESSNLKFYDILLEISGNPSKIGFINGYYIHCEMWGHA